MNRVSRIRKPSQKAREIAEAALFFSSKPSSSDPLKSNANQSNKKISDLAPNFSSSRAKVKIGSRKGRATINSSGDVDVEEEASTPGKIRLRGISDGTQQDPKTGSACTDALETAQDPDILYCICLGHDDHTPMIQCEGCENWFHFSCLKLDPAEAQEIAAFYCQVCHASGTGTTLKINEAAMASETLPEPAPHSTPSPLKHTRESSPVEATIDDTIPQELNAETVHCSPTCETEDLRADIKSSVPSSPQVMKRPSSDLDKEESQAGPKQSLAGNTVPLTITSKPTRRKQKLAEGLSSQEDTSDQDFTGDEPSRIADRKRKTPTSIDSRRSTQPRLSVSTPFSPSPSTPTTPALGPEKTRKTCTQQFFKLFEPIFYNKFKGDREDSQDPELQNRSDEAAMRFSEAVESEVFESFGELDAHNQKAPRRQYMTKLRSLLFNLKNNPDFLNSLSFSDLSPRLIVCMSHEDLQTPQQKALAEQIRQRSLHNSVKTRVPGLSTGTSQETDEDVIARLSQSIVVEIEAAVDNTNGARHVHPDSDHRRESLSSAPASTASHSASIVHPRNPLSQSNPPNAIKPSHTATDPQTVDVKENTSLTTSDLRQAENTTSSGLSSNLLRSFDLEKVFAAIRSVPASLSVNAHATNPQSGDAEGQKGAKEGDSDDSMDLENTPERDIAGNSQTATQEGTIKSLPDDYDPFVLANGVDADLDAILHGDPLAASPSCSTKVFEAQKTVPTPTPIVWTGNVMTADAGGFAACALQVGGRSLSPDGSALAKLIPTDTMTVVGRLSVKDSTNYLVQSHFAPTRELVILELRPNLKGPPDLPSPERVIQHKQNLIEFFTKKGRHAVVAVNDKVKQTVRDIYLVPILRQDALPEFVQLLDNVSIPESVPREQDIMIAVIVLSRGAVQPSWRPPATVHPTDSSFNHRPHETAPASSSPNTTDGKHLSAPNHAPSVVSPYPALPVPVGMNPIPLLQSLGGSTQLPFSLLQPLPSSIPTAATTPGPPPGFVPYIQAQSNLPPASSNPPLDLSQVDVSALQALLLNQQVLQPILNLPPSQAQLPSQPLPQPPPNLPLLPSSAQRTGRSQISTNDGPRNNTTLPTPPRPINLPLNPNLAHHNAHSSLSPPHQNQPWSASDRQHRQLPINPYPSNNKDTNQQQRKGLMRMGEMITSPLYNEENHRRRGQHSGSPGGATRASAGGGGGGSGGGSSGVGRPKRHSYEFVAPPRDGGWAGRGRGKRT